jgi:hypothetical protein
MHNTHTHTHTYTRTYIYIYINNILYIVSTPTCFAAPTSSSGIIILLLCQSYKSRYGYKLSKVSRLNRLHMWSLQLMIKYDVQNVVSCGNCYNNSTWTLLATLTSLFYINLLHLQTVYTTTKLTTSMYYSRSMTEGIAVNKTTIFVIYNNVSTTCFGHFLSGHHQVG